LLPPTTEAYIKMEKENIDLKKVLDGEKEISGKEYYILAKEKIASSIDHKKARENNIDFDKAFALSDSLIKAAKKDTAVKEYPVSKTLDAVFTPEQYETIKAQKLVITQYPDFMGFKLKNLYDFFMLFVVLCGLAGLILYALTPMMKKMMHGVR